MIDRPATTPASVDVGRRHRQVVDLEEGGRRAPPHGEGRDDGRAGAAPYCSTPRRIPSYTAAAALVTPSLA